MGTCLALEEIIDCRIPGTVTSCCLGPDDKASMSADDNFQREVPIVSVQVAGARGDSWTRFDMQYQMTLVDATGTRWWNMCTLQRRTLLHNMHGESL